MKVKKLNDEQHDVGQTIDCSTRQEQNDNFKTRGKRRALRSGLSRTTYRNGRRELRFEV